MRVLLHIANLNQGGGMQVALSLLEEMALMPDIDAGVLYAAEAAPWVAQLPDRIARFEVPESPTRSLTSLSAFRKLAARAEQEFRPDKALTVFGPGLWRPSVPHLVGFANGLYLFDDSDFLRQWPRGPVARMRYKARRYLLLRALRNEGDRYWVETAQAAHKLADALRTEPNLIDVVPNTASRRFYEEQGAPDTGDPRWFDLLCLYAPHPNKNLELIAALLPLVQDTDIRFLVSLADGAFNRIFDGQQQDHHLLNLGVVAPADAPAAYRRANAVFLPSLLETFSASFPEAMQTGRPILASDRPFARELCGNAALYFDPYSAEDAWRCIRQLRDNTVLQQQLVQEGRTRFSRMITPAQRAERIVAILASMNP